MKIELLNEHERMLWQSIYVTEHAKPAPNNPVMEADLAVHFFRERNRQPSRSGFWMGVYLKSITVGRTPAMAAADANQAEKYSLNKVEKLIKVSYGIITEESAAENDYAETGWCNEDWTEDSGTDPVDFMLQFGSVEPSRSEWKSGVWYTQIDTEYNEKQHAFHLTGFTEEEEKEIFRKINAKLRRV